ncbi:MAG: FAD-dependent oxidoreductase [Lachnospiraceae bacterium]|nr:FAD-dependent oxidoreductase [Lachnospiraceae bacterium]
MIRVTQLRMSIDYIVQNSPAVEVRHGVISKEEENCVRVYLAQIMNVLSEDIHDLKIVKKSIDARKKQNETFVYTVEFKALREHKLANIIGNTATVVPDGDYQEENHIMKDVALQIALGRRPKKRPVVVGMGPAGLFAALVLAQSGLSPIIIERGSEVGERAKKVEAFFSGDEELDPECNVQFGEGGAGTFSDGKLNSGVKDKDGKIKYILETFANYGAPSQILYEAKPHVGTDRLRDVVIALRERIIALGGEVFFNTRFEEPVVDFQGNLMGIIVTQGDQRVTIDCDKLILATGHSARDTFKHLYDFGMNIIPKSFAIGVRVQHSQDYLNTVQYGRYGNILPPATYKVTYHTSTGRGVYSFCMCPGGYVVNASSVPGRLCVNGMSYYNRESPNANSAIVVTVGPQDFGSTDPLSGVYFQDVLEKYAYNACDGRIPLQLYGDFRENRISSGFGTVQPVMKGKFGFANLRDVLPKYVSESIIEGMGDFGRRIPGFDADDTIMSGIESRTSSPIRMVRDENFISNIKGIYPCGEGAGYAGGIMSAAVDGMKVAEQIAATTELM